MTGEERRGLQKPRVPSLLVPAGPLLTSRVAATLSQSTLPLQLSVGLNSPGGGEGCGPRPKAGDLLTSSFHMICSSSCRDVDHRVSKCSAVVGGATSSFSFILYFEILSCSLFLPPAGLLQHCNTADHQQGARSRIESLRLTAAFISFMSLCSLSTLAFMLLVEL